MTGRCNKVVLLWKVLVMVCGSVGSSIWNVGVAVYGKCSCGLWKVWIVVYGKFG